MKIFISWSGELSRRLGQAFRDWLPTVLQAAQPYFTPDDIEKGAKWESDVSLRLSESQIGIFCMTAENLNSPWMMFEAGAISNMLGKTHVCPILFGIDPQDVTMPLNQFQLTPFNKDEIHKLLSTINAQGTDLKLADKTLDSVFAKWWPDLEKLVLKTIKDHSEDKAAPERPQQDILEELLSLTRLISKQTSQTIPIIIRGADYLDDFDVNSFRHLTLNDQLHISPTFRHSSDSAPSYDLYNKLLSGLLRQFPTQQRMQDGDASELTEATESPKGDEQ